MPQYSPPIRDLKFVLHEVFDAVGTLKLLPKHAEIDHDTVNAVLEEGGKFAAEVVHPLNLVGDYGGGALYLAFGIMAALWEAGRLVERLYSSPRFLVIYALSGLTGNVVSLIAQGDQAVAGGASGAVFGVYGALLVCLWREREQVNRTEFRWLFWGAALFAAVTIALGFIVKGIDNAAHLGGLVFGLLLGVGVAPTRAESMRSRWSSFAASPAREGIVTIAVCVLLVVIFANWFSLAQLRVQLPI